MRLPTHSRCNQSYPPRSGSLAGTGQHDPPQRTKYVLGEIAGRTQMHAYFAPAIDYDGGKYGIGLLTKEIPVSLKTMTLPGREEARALIMAEFDNYIYCCTHLSLTEEDRMASLELIKDFAAAHKNLFSWPAT